MEIEVGPLTGVYKNMPRGIVALVFRCRATTAPRTSSAEATEIGWWDVECVSDFVAEAYAVRIEDAIHAEAPHVRAHDGTRVLPSR